MTYQVMFDLIGILSYYFFILRSFSVRMKMRRRGCETIDEEEMRMRKRGERMRKRREGCETMI